MGSTTCLFSRARPGNPTPKKVRGFLALPAEIRNMIYEYYFESDFRCEFGAVGCQFTQRKRRTVKLQSNLVKTGRQISKYNTKEEYDSPITIRISRPLGKYTTVQGLQTNWLASLYALNLVCKQIYAETLTLLYRKTEFVFQSPRRIKNFLGVVSRPKLQEITKLQLHYSTYGSPKRRDDIVWQDKYDMSWTQACKAISQKLLNLRELEIWIQVNHNPLRFNLHEPWVKPILQFRRLTRAPKSAEVSASPDPPVEWQKSLKVANVHIRTRWSTNPLKAFGHNQELAMASEDLHLLFGQAVGLAILGAKEQEAMRDFNTAWSVTYRDWQYHLGFAKTGW